MGLAKFPLIIITFLQVLGGEEGLGLPKGLETRWLLHSECDKLVFFSLCCSGLLTAQ